MTVFDNVALPLREHTRLSEEDIAAEVTRRLVAVGLPETERLYPRQLSGGMCRRAALARTVVTDPVSVDFATATATWRNETFSMSPLGPAAQELILAGGLEALTQQKMRSGG